MSTFPTLRFAVIGIDHRHIYDQVSSLQAIGAECAGYFTHGEPLTLKGFQERFGSIPRVADPDRLLEDPSIQLIVCAAIPCQRAAIAVDVMRHGKDFMVDKPGVTTFEQLEQVRQAQRETGRIYTINFTERFEVRAVTRATELVRAGAIGQVLQTVGLGPHRLNRQTRPPWFFDPRQNGGILVDVASHQIDQFLHFAQADDARIVVSRYGNLGHPEDPGMQDFGEIILAHGPASGYIRVDWFTPDGLATWGDGRLTILGSHGYIELRKYVDIAGRPGKDHLFLVDGQGTRYIDCSDAALPYYTDLRRDIFERTGTDSRHPDCFKVTELALTAQARAEIIPSAESLPCTK
jgi:predicted dehydrogenase